jgi:resuscitation-promoting factor RpfA
VADGAAAGRSGAAVVLTAVLGCCAFALGRAAFLEAEGLWAHRSDLQFDDLVLTAALGGLALAGGWLAVGIVLTLGTRALRCSHTLAGRLARAITPSLVRSLLGGACGAAVLVAPTTAPGALALAPDTSHAQSLDCPRRSCSDVRGGLPMPDRPWGTRAAPRATRPEPELVRVRRGDSLWAIAADHLTGQHLTAQQLTAQQLDAQDPADHASPPSQAEIAAAWPRWFDLNRARIGDDPDLIHPGTRLVAPRRLR